MKKLFLTLLLVLPLSGARADEITVSAAASLKDALTQIGADFSRAQPQTRVNFNFGSSGALQKQIEAGAPVDVFVAASAKNVDQLVAQGALDGATKRLFARGELVLIAPTDSKLRAFAALRGPGVQNIAIGGPGVPAGDYARQTLGFLGLTAAVAPKLVFAKDVRSVLAQVEAGNVEAGLVYRTDALTSKRVKIVAVAPPQSHQPVVYPMAVVKAAPNPPGARKFWNFLQGASAKRVLKRLGFNG